MNDPDRAELSRLLLTYGVTAVAEQIAQETERKCREEYADNEAAIIHQERPLILYCASELRKIQALRLRGIL